mmetsp:Transcript_4003/g.7788  ORF Transcript_4003/g.7788 Transcript_4003/m.7788 type:complete len:201 (+) Transcript_4003:309-911(+)
MVASVEVEVASHQGMSIHSEIRFAIPRALRTLSPLTACATASRGVNVDPTSHSSVVPTGVICPMPAISSNSTRFVFEQLFNRFAISGDSSIASSLKRINSVSGVLYPLEIISRLSIGLGVNSRVPFANSPTEESSCVTSGINCLVNRVSGMSWLTCGAQARVRSWSVSAIGLASAGSPPGTASDTGLLLKDISTERCMHA